MLTSKIFENSFFYIGAGYDFEPLYRFSNVCENYIYVTSHVDKNEVKSELEKLKLFPDLKLNKIEEVKNFDENKHLEINKNFEVEINEIMSVFTKNEKRDYDQIFSNEIEDQKWMFRVDLERNNCKIKLWYLGGEGIRYLIMLSRGGKYIPKILSTIQTGCLEYVNGLNTRIIKKIGKNPKVWVRGFEATPYLTKFYYQSKIFNTDNLYSEVGMDFNFNWNVNTSYIGYQNRFSTRYCKAYITKEYKYIIDKTPYKRYKKNEILRIDILKLINDKKLKGNDLLIITRNIYEKIKNKELHKNIRIWEEVLKTKNIYNNHMYNSIEYLKILGTEKKFENVYFIPFGLEDQSKILDKFLENSYDTKMIPLVYRPLDLIDLRAVKVL